MGAAEYNYDSIAAKTVQLYEWVVEGKWSSSLRIPEPDELPEELKEGLDKTDADFSQYYYYRRPRYYRRHYYRPRYYYRPRRYYYRRRYYY